MEGRHSSARNHLPSRRKTNSIFDHRHPATPTKARESGSRPLLTIPALHERDLFQATASLKTVPESPRVPNRRTSSLVTSQKQTCATNNSTRNAEKSCP